MVPLNLGVLGLNCHDGRDLGKGRVSLIFMRKLVHIFWHINCSSFRIANIHLLFLIWNSCLPSLTYVDLLVYSCFLCFLLTLLVIFNCRRWAVFFLRNLVNVQIRVVSEMVFLVLNHTLKLYFESIEKHGEYHPRIIRYIPRV